MPEARRKSATKKPTIPPIPAPNGTRRKTSATPDPEVLVMVPPSGRGTAKANDAKARAALLSHDDLTRLGANWLRNNGYVAFRESGATPENCREIADVIGWNARSHSVLLECKKTREDFRRDAEKSFRKHSVLGFGVHRYYLCPAGLLLASDMPPKWGLLWAYEKKVVQVKTPEAFDPKAAAVAEKPLMTALMYRFDTEMRDFCERHKVALPPRCL